MEKQPAKIFSTSPLRPRSLFPSKKRDAAKKKELERDTAPAAGKTASRPGDPFPGSVPGDLKAPVAGDQAAGKDAGKIPGKDPLKKESAPGTAAGGKDALAKDSTAPRISDPLKNGGKPAAKAADSAAPGKDSKTATPAKDGKTAASAKDSKAAAPTKDGKTAAAPAKDGKTAAPAKDGKTAAAGNDSKTSAPAKDGKAPEKPKRRRHHLITFKNIPVVKLVYYGFGILMVMLLISGISSFNAFSDLNTAFNAVTQKTTPLVITAGKLEKDMNVSHKALVEILTSQNAEEITKLTQIYSAQNNILKQTVSEFTALVENEPRFEELVTELNAHLNKYSSYTGTIPQDYLNLVQEQIKVNKEISSYRALVNLFTEEYNNIKFQMKDEDDYVHQLMLAPEPLKGMMATNTDAALNSEDLATVEEALKKNQGAIKLYLSQINEIKRDLPTFENDVGRYYKNFAISVAEDTGVLSMHLNLVRKKTELRRITLKANEELMSLSEIIASMSAISNSEMNASVNGAYKIISSSYIKLTAVILIGMIVALLVAYVVGRVINVPLTRIVRSINAMAEGDMTVPVRFNARSEFGYLAKKMNSLIETFGATLSNLSQSARTLQENAHSNSESMVSTAEKIQVQQEQTQQIVSSINMMRASADNVAESAATSLNRIIEVNDAAETGRKIMSDNITTNHELAHRLKITSEAIKNVNETSNNIGTIVEVIKDIAEQTNLLALNAAIESARAGEHGRGFAVVADEVRSLAQKTSVSTTEVQKLIESLQSVVSNAVETIKNCEKEMEHSVMQTSAANSSIEEIKAILTSINDMAHQIASAAEEQRCTSNEVASNVSRISEISEINASEINKSKVSCQALDNLATEQKRMVERFKFQESSQPAPDQDKAPADDPQQNGKQKDPAAEKVPAPARNKAGSAKPVFPAQEKSSAPAKDKAGSAKPVFPAPEKSSTPAKDKAGSLKPAFPAPEKAAAPAKDKAVSPFGKPADQTGASPKAPAKGAPVPPSPAAKGKNS